MYQNNSQNSNNNQKWESRNRPATILSMTDYTVLPPNHTQIIIQANMTPYQCPPSSPN